MTTGSGSSPQLLLVLCAFTLLRSATSTVKSSSFHCRPDGEKIICEVTLDKSSSASLWEFETCVENNNNDCFAATISRVSIDNESSPNTLRVGKRVYEKPFDKKYDPAVASVLDSITKLRQNVKATDVEMADAFFSLGLAHRRDSHDKSFKHRSTINNDLTDENVNDSINAFSQALLLYSKQLPHIEEQMELDNILFETGTVTMYLADTYQMYPTRTNHNQEETLKYYRDAEEMFRSLKDSRLLDSNPGLYEDVGLTWASVLVSVGVLQIENLHNDASTLGAASLDISDLLEETKTPVFDEFIDKCKDSYSKFSDAIDIYRLKATTSKEIGVKFQYDQLVASTLHSRGTASSYLGNSMQCIEDWEEAIQIYRKHLNIPAAGIDRTDTSVISELMYSLSEKYLEVGNYDKANESYKQAMKLYAEQGNLPLLTTPELIEESVDTTNSMLAEQENLLSEYIESTYGGYGSGEIHIPDDYRDPGDPIYQPDELYEGSLYASIGSVYIMRNELEKALEYLQKALELYEKNVGKQDVMVADVKLSMASIFLQQKEYEASEITHREAMEIYRQFYGEGKSPFDIDGINLENQNKNAESPSGNYDGSNVVHERLINVDEYKVLNNTIVDYL